MKNSIRLISAIAIILAIVFLYFWLKSPKADEVTVSHTMVVQQIEGLGNLELVKYNIQDIMDFEKTRRWLPNSKMSLKVVGEVIACIDLTRIKAENIYTQNDSVSLVLPLPEICHYKVDHSKSKVYNIEYGLWETASLVDEAYRTVELHLYSQAQKMGIANESRTNAIKVLTPILHGLGFKRIHIGFESPHDSENKILDLTN